MRVKLESHAPFNIEVMRGFFIAKTLNDRISGKQMSF